MKHTAGVSSGGAIVATLDAVAFALPVLESMSEGVSVTDEQGFIVYTNPAEDKLFGYAAGELVGQPVSVLNTYPPEENARRVDDVIAELHRQGSWTGEWHNRRKDGSSFLTDSRITAVQSGGRRYLVCVQHDITERKLEEERRRLLADAVELDRQQLRVTLDSLVQGLVILDSHAKIIYANPAALMLHGFRSVADMMQSVDDLSSRIETRYASGRLMPVREWPAVRALNGETVLDVEIHVKRLDIQREFVGSYSARPIRDESGKVIRVVATTYDLTERQRAQEALLESERRFRLLVHAMPQLAWVCTPDGYVDFANQRWLDYTGQTLEQAYGRGWMNALHPDDAESIAPAWDKAIREGSVLETNYRVRRASDGEYRWHLTRAVPLRDQLDGSIVRWFGTNTDIEDHLRAEARLRETAERFSLALAAARLGDWRWDSGSDIVDLSDSAAAMFGVPPGPVMSWTGLQQLLHPEDRGRAVASVNKAIAERSDYDIEYRVHHPDGTWKWILARGRGIHAEDGSVRGMLGIVQDITERKLAEQELRRAKDRVTTILESITDAFLALDREWRFTYVNREAERILLRRREELIGKSIWEEFPPARESAFYHEYTRAVREQTSVQFEEYYAPLQTWFEVYAYPSSEGLAVYFQNVNERRRIEAERVTALRELQRSNDELQLANSDLEQFAFAASHDLREPLRMITSYTQLLQRRLGDQLQGETLQFMQQIISGADRMNLLLQDLLAYTETARKSNLPVDNVSLDSVVEQSIANLSAFIIETGAIVEAGPLPVVAGRPGYFLQLFQNLIGNAIKYRRTGVPPIVTVSATRERDFWVISVTDNGLGIEPEYHRQIFGVFKRLHGREIPGTGIGLAICQKVVEQAGGQIWVESTPGEGSRFLFTIPVI